MQSVLKIAAAVVGTTILCGFSDRTLEYKLNAYQGLPVSAVIARFGDPIQKQIIEGKKVYFWSITYIDDRHYSCKVRAILDRQDIVTNWGYEGCAF